MDIREQSQLIYNNSQSKRSIVDEINYRPLVSEADEDQSLVTDILRGKQATAGWHPQNETIRISGTDVYTRLFDVINGRIVRVK